jgi:hypothetical protein
VLVGFYPPARGFKRRLLRLRSSQIVKGSYSLRRFIPIEPGLSRMDEQHLTMSDVFSLFGRHTEDTRWVASADSQEYLAVVLYLVQRNSGR